MAVAMAIPVAAHAQADAAAPPEAPRAPGAAVQARAVVHASHALHAYQGRNNRAEQSERFSRKIRIGRDGRVTVSNIAGEISVSAGSGDEVSIEAVKRTRGDQGELANVRITVDERAGHVDVRTEGLGFTSRNGRGNSVSVDYTLTVPAGVAVELKSVSGNIKVTGVRGAVRAETISGDVTTTDTPKLEAAKSVSGDVRVSGISTDSDAALGSISGNVTAKAVKVRSLELSSVSGDLSATDVSCERLTAKSVSGSVEYAGSLAKGGAYDVNVHSGNVRLTLASPSGFVLNASSFSGSIRSDLPLTIGGDAADRDRRDRRGGMGNRSMRATYGDGSATVTLRTFSGDIVIAKR
jgi:DUF4097 and DUF4098 domain-containing protein YvlB